MPQPKAAKRRQNSHVSTLGATVAKPNPIDQMLTDTTRAKDLLAFPYY